MAPAQHLDWFDDNITWFGRIPPARLGADVANCPGWSVEDVLTHLAFGLGLGYRYALQAPPDCPDDLAFADVPWPTETPSGAEALRVFEVEMQRCAAAFRRTDPSKPCYTYAGPGMASFWFRRAAIETTLHRMDVADALGVVDSDPSPDRSADALAETVEFALPLASRWTSTRLPAMVIEWRTSSPEGSRLVVGDGPIAASITGSGPDLLAALWGRRPEAVSVDGDRAVAEAWMSLVETAFAGR